MLNRHSKKTLFERQEFYRLAAQMTMDNKLNLTSKYNGLAQLAVIILSVYLTSFYSYLLFHTLAELISVIIALVIFVVTWNARRYLENNYFLFLGIAFLFFGFVDLLHTLAYKGLGIFHTFSGANLATQLWLAARLLMSLSFLIAPILIGKRLKANRVVAVFAAMTALLLLSIFDWKIFPVAFDEQTGLTAFKKFAEGLISAFLIISLVLLYLKKNKFDSRVYGLLSWSLVATVISEILFTRYGGVYDIVNLSGHLLKIIAYFLVYLGLVETGIMEPYRYIFKEFQDNEAALRQSEEKFRAIFENAAVGIVLADMTGRPVETNEKFRRMIGYTGQELRQMEFEDFTFPEDVTLDLGQFREMKKGLLDSYHLEKRYLTKKGEVLWVDLNVSLVRGAAGEPLYTLGVISNVTKRKTADAALAKNKSEFEAIFNSISDAVVFADVDRKMVMVNPAVSKIFGYRTKELLGQSTEIFYADNKDFRRMGRQRYNVSSAAGLSPERFSKPFEVKYKRKDGTIFEAESLGGRVLDTAGRVIGFIGIHRDIGERKQYERKIEHLASFAQLNPQPIIELDAAGDIIFLNPATKKLLAAGGGRDGRRLLPDDIDDIISGLEKVRQDTVLHREVAFGDQIFYEDILASKKLGVVRLYLKDITARKRAEEIMRKHSQEMERLVYDLEKFQLAVKNAKDLIIITDPEGKIVFANQAAVEMTGYSREEIINSTASLWGGQMKKEFYRKMWQTIKVEKSAFGGEVVNRRKTGEHFMVDIHVSPIVDGDNNVQFFVGIERDITKAKETDRAKTEFVSLASHQLRTPLSSISLSAELLLRGISGPLEEKQRKYLEEIYNSTQRMAELINALLNISRLELGTFAVKPQPIDLARSIDQITAELALQLNGKKLKLKKNYAKDLPIIEFDQNILRIIVENLLTNAIRYTPAGGNISIKLEKRNPDILLIVKDTGCGIPAEAKAKIFSKLFRAENAKEVSSEGAGLGLYIVRAAAEKAGAKIWFDSVVAKGTTFYVSIPAKSGTVL